MPVGSPLLDHYDQTGEIPPALARAITNVSQTLGALPPGFGQMPPPAPGATLQPPQAAPPPLTAGPSRALPASTLSGIPGTPPMGGAPSSGIQPAAPSTGTALSTSVSRSAPQPPISPALANAKQGFSRLTHQLTPEERAGGLEHTKQDTGASGIDQIKNPWARVPLHILEGLGTMFAPNLTMALPGTQLHHNMLVRNAAGAVNEQENAAEKEARAAHELAEANAGPKAGATKEPKLITDPAGNVIGYQDEQGAMHSEQDPNMPPEVRKILDTAKGKAAKTLQPHYEKGEDGTIYAISFDPTTGKSSEQVVVQGTGKKAGGPEGELPLGPERVSQYNSMLADRYNVLHKGKALPSHYNIPANATQKDYERIDKALEAEERATGTKEQQEQTNEMRRQTAAMNAEHFNRKEDTALRAATLKAYTPSLESAERFNVMTKNYEDAVKNHDQQAMLSLLANHLGMTMGLQKGSRITKDILNEAVKSRPMLQGIGAKFDKDGYLSGVTLTVPQMRQMVDLGRERFSEDVNKGKSESNFLGGGEGPERTPSKATINHYVALANGDVNKAKQLASADGWSIK